MTAKIIERAEVPQLHPHPLLHPPKRAVVSHHSPQLIKDTYSGGKPADSITSALYVEDPWKNIDKVSVNI